MLLLISCLTVWIGLGEADQPEERYNLFVLFIYFKREAIILLPFLCGFYADGFSSFGVFGILHGTLFPFGRRRDVNHR